MTRGAKFILGLTVALITAASLQYTIGGRFNKYGQRNFGHPGCSWHKTQKHNETSKAPLSTDTLSGELNK